MQTSGQQVLAVRHVGVPLGLVRGIAQALVDAALEQHQTTQAIALIVDVQLRASFILEQSPGASWGAIRPSGGPTLWPDPVSPPGGDSQTDWGRVDPAWLLSFRKQSTNNFEAVWPESYSIGR